MSEITIHPFTGLFGTGDFNDADMRPKSWRQQIFMTEPNGDLPLLGISAMAKKNAVTDPEFSWWEEIWPSRMVAHTELYTNAALDSTYASGATAGDTLYAKMSEVNATQFRVGQQVNFLNSTYAQFSCIGRVTAVVFSDANSYVAVRLLEADDNSSGVSGTTVDLSDATHLLIIASVNPEGSGVPEQVMYQPEKLNNYTQIFRTPVELTKTAKATSNRLGISSLDFVKEKQSWEHARQIEMAMLNGIPTESTGANGKPERTTGGLLNFIRSYAPSTHISDFRADGTTDGSWNANGLDWLEDMIVEIFTYGPSKRTAICGYGPLVQIGRAIRSQNSSNFMLSPTTKAWGLNVRTLVTPAGQLTMLVHPMLNISGSLADQMIIFPQESLQFRPLQGRDTSYEDYDTGGQDGLQGGWLTEGGVEFSGSRSSGVLTGFGYAPPTS